MELGALDVDRGHITLSKVDSIIYGRALSILPRCRPDRLRRPVRDLASTGAPATRCRSHRYGCRRTVRTTDCLEWLAVDQNSSCGFRCSTDRDRPRFPHHVSNRLLEIHDGPFLELGLKGIVGQVIQVPRRSVDRPDRDRLARRFEDFKKAA